MTAERLVALRHEFHRYPELGYEEHGTAARIVRELTALGIPHETGVGGTGVVGRLPGTSGRRIALRADMDALPITERTGAAYASETPGKMHACGHDGHMTMLLGAAARLAAEPSEHEILVVFQPAEEGGAGAKRIVDSGILEGVHAVYGQHGWPGVPLGAHVVKAGAMMASADSFEVVLTGRGAHAAQPHLAVDPVVAAAHLTVALQTMVSRTASPFEPVVLTVGRIDAGTAHNVIPSSACVIGTLRTLSDESEERMKGRLNEIVAGVAAAFGCSASTAWLPNGYPVTLNDPELTERAATIVGAGPLAEPSMAGEDFAFYRSVAPSCYLFLGLGETAGLHADTFDFPDAALPYGVEALVRLARDG